MLTPSRVQSPAFGALWQSPVLDAHEGLPPRLFASPLYVGRVRIAADGVPRREYSVVYAAATTGYVYAVNARATASLAAGALLWRQRLTAAPCSRGAYGILGTPVIDARRARLYVSVCDQSQGWAIHALDLRSGDVVVGEGIPCDRSAAADDRRCHQRAGQYYRSHH